jgi:hypothetical protein
MKGKIILVGLFVLGFALPGKPQVAEIIKIVTEKLIRAIDLKVQAMQNEIINLQVIQKQAENKLSKKELAEISGWEQQQKELYQNYYASLKKVKPVLSGNKLVGDIQQQQVLLAGLMDAAIIRIRQDPHLVQKERTSFVSTCITIRKQSQAIKIQMEQALRDNRLLSTDAQRIAFLNEYAKEVSVLLARFQQMDYSINRLSLSRAKTARENWVLKQLYGL